MNHLSIRHLITGQWKITKGKHTEYVEQNHEVRRYNEMLNKKQLTISQRQERQES